MKSEYHDDTRGSRERYGRFPLCAAWYVPVVLAALAGCTAGDDSVSTAGDVRPSIRAATIQPNPIVLSGAISVQAEANAQGRRTVRFRYRWIVNGHPLPNQQDYSLDPSALKQGDRVTVEVTPYDEQSQGSVFRTAEAVVSNTPPVVRGVVLELNQKRGGTVLQASVDSLDPDQDEIHHKYRWWKNKDLLMEGENNSLEAKDLLQTDVIVVSVTPRDRTGTGQEVYSDPLTIGNRPPTITSSPPSLARDDRYEYVVTALDPENERVTYSLETSPPGMEIEEESGRLTWLIQSGSSGGHKVRVVARDGHGGTAFQEFEITIPASSPTKPERA